MAWEPLPDWVDKGPGLPDLLRARGYDIMQLDNRIYGSDAAAIAALAATYDPLPDAKAARLPLVDAELERRMHLPFRFNGVDFQVDPASQAKITAQGALALASLSNPATVPWPPGFCWIAADNSRVAMDAAAMLSFAAAVAGHVGGLIFAARARKDAILALASVAAVAAADTADF